MAINWQALVGQQISLSGLNANIVPPGTGQPSADANITVDSVDTAAGVIVGHYANRTFVVPITPNFSFAAVGNSANALLNLTT